MTRAMRLKSGLRLFTALLLSVHLAVVIVWSTIGAVMSLSWPLYHDSPILFYIARQIRDQGLVPYRQIFDMNMPVTYFIYMGIDTIARGEAFGLRCVDMAILALLGVISFRMFPRLDLSGRLYAAFMFPLIYLTTGPELSFQREYLALVPLSLAVYFLARGGRIPVSLRFFASGLCFGVAAMIKPHLLIGAPLALICLLTPWGRTSMHTESVGQILRKAAPPLFAGVALPAFGTLFYLDSVQAIEPLYALWREYLPLYGKITYNMTLLRDEQYLRYHLLYLFTNLNFIPILVLGLTAVGFHIRSRDVPDREKFTALLIGSQCLAYWFYPSFSGQYWFYHWVPLAYWLTLLLAYPASIRSMRFPVPLHALAAAGLVFWTLMMTRPDNGILALEDHNAKPRVQLAHSLADYLRSELRPGDHVQPLDWTDAGIVHGLLLSDTPLATSFVYDFHFYHHASNPVILGLRERFLEELRRSRPRFIVEGLPGPPYLTGPDTQVPFQALSAYLILNYRMSHLGPELAGDRKLSYRIWELSMPSSGSADAGASAVSDTPDTANDF